MADQIVKLRSGRTWSVDSSGLKSVERKYIVYNADGSKLFSSENEPKEIAGIPAIGTAHPSQRRLKVREHRIEEGAGAESNSLIVTAVYGLPEGGDQGEGGEGGEGEATNYQCTEWGWDSSTDSRELNADAVTGSPICNSAGDVYASVPTISVTSPVFTKAMKFVDRQSGALDKSCKVNESPVTIGGISYPAATLLCTISEKRIFNDLKYNYLYTVQLKYRTNKVVLNGSGSPEEIGWDVAITDAGMRERDREGKLVLIKSIDPETGTPFVVTSPELLDGSGRAVDRTSSGEVTAINRRYNAYQRTSLPEWFYSEPPIVKENERNNS